jgi:hypothetical protein
MKPIGQRGGLIVVRSAGAVVGVVPSSLILAGCTSGRSAAGSSSVGSATDASSRIPTVSTGSPTPSAEASERAPTAVRGATLVRRTGITTTPPPPTVVTIHVGTDVARHLAALLNALPPEPGGPADAGGGANTTITVTFDGDPSDVQYVVAGSFYDAVTVRGPSQALPTLSGAGDLDNYLEGLF